MRQVDLDKVPARVKSASRMTGDEEETIGGKGDCCISWERRNRRFGMRADGSGGSSRNQSDRKRERCGNRGVGVGNVAESKQRRVIGRQGRREPHVVAHLNIEGRFERIDQWGMRVIEAAEIGRVDGFTRKESRWKRRQGLGQVFEQRRCRATVKTDKAAAQAGRFDNLVRATFAMGEFGDGSSRGVAVDLDFGHDKVVDCKDCRGS